MKDTNLLIQNGVNVEKGIQLLGDIETYNEMLEDFLTEVTKKIASINSYKIAKDMPNYAILTHSLKSDSKYFGFDKLAELAYQHELESKNNNISFVEANSESLNTETNRIIDLVKKYLGK
ncbi:MAG: Hpt domain-containing protein [Bacilli bacterium]|nr:Hpt domain-containing protein [Bacilli bacterium]